MFACSDWKFSNRATLAVRVPMVLDAATVATMHSDAERIPITEFLKGLHIYFDVLRSNF